MWMILLFRINETIEAAPDDPTKTNYTFEGWYTDNTTFTDEWDFDND
jgi:hypothetical protein